MTLHGNVHPMARPEFDRGPVADSDIANRMTLLLQRSSDQEIALRQLLEQQQDKSSQELSQVADAQSIRDAIRPGRYGYSNRHGLADLAGFHGNQGGRGPHHDRVFGKRRAGAQRISN